MQKPPFDLAAAHRWFAVEFNNRAWDLVEKEGRSAEETAELLDSAHAAALHWRAAGTPLNAERSQCLLATAYARLGKAEPALRHAQQCLMLSEQNFAAGTETLFDRASALGCAARAHALAGDLNEAERLRFLADAAAAELATDERGVYDQLYG